MHVRIAHVTPYFQPQLGYEEHYLTREQKRAGNEVCIITSDRYFSFPDYKDSVEHILGSRKVGTGLFNVDGVSVYRLPCLYEWGAAIVVYGMKRALKIFAPDVVHAHYMLYPSSILASLNKSMGFKLVVDQHMINDDQPRSPWKFFAYRIYKRLAFQLLSRRVDRFIALTPAVLRWLQEEFNVDSRSITLVPLGADASFFRRDEQFRAQYRNLLHLSDDELLVTYAGKLLPEKDIDVLIKGVAPLIEEYGKMKVLLLGSGSKRYVSEILALAKSHNIAESLILHDLVDRGELVKFYNASDVGVWLGRPSITIIEAMSCGLPVVLAKSLQTCHLLAYDNGFSFSPGDPNEFKMCLERLVEDENLRLSMGQRSRKLVEEKLNWCVIAKKTLDIYREVLSN